jgi:hypothetical protein
VSKAHHPDAGDGRKIKYPESQYRAIVQRYAEGENILSILGEPEMPSWYAFFTNVISSNAPEELQTLYASAQESWAIRALAETPAIADTIDEGVEETISDGPKGQTVTRKRVDRLGHRSLRIGVRQWHAERMLAKLASKHALVGADGKVANIVPVINMTVLAAPKEDSK